MTNILYHIIKIIIITAMLPIALLFDIIKILIRYSIYMDRLFVRIALRAQEQRA